MHLNIAQKIFGIAVVVLTLMVAVAVFSIHLTAKISEELETVVSRHLPLSDTIGHINVKILEQGLLIQRLFVLPKETPQAISRIKILDGAINEGFIRAHELFKAEEQITHPLAEIISLERSLSTVEREYQIFEKHALELMILHKSGDSVAFEILLPELNKQQDLIDTEIANLRRHVESAAELSVKRANGDEKFLLVVNAGLTTIATVLGLGLAAIITFALVRNVRNLLHGAEAVEEGDLDTAVPIMTHDEVGRLTASFNKMVEGLKTKELIKDTFGKYMDPRIVTKLLEDSDFTHIGGERVEMTVMFIDLKGFTSISEKLPPDDLVRMINGFFSHMTEAISSNSGVVDKFMGDAVMAYWGPPFTSSHEHATLACKAALSALDNLNLFRIDAAEKLDLQLNNLDIDLRIGISTGEMILGTIGSKASRSFTVMGDPVNLGSRLEGVNKTYGTRIVLSERTRQLAGKAIYARELDLIRVQGKMEPTRIFELLDAEPEADRFNAGLSAYRNQDWQTAKNAFNSCVDECSTDSVSKVYLQRIVYLEANPPVAGWDGGWDFRAK